MRRVWIVGTVNAFILQSPTDLWAYVQAHESVTIQQMWAGGHDGALYLTRLQARLADCRDTNRCPYCGHPHAESECESHCCGAPIAWGIAGEVRYSCSGCGDELRHPLPRECVHCGQQLPRQRI